jgi:CRISPR/Cas system CMR-associated protein Cmr1 (group 7 of RAMP superfamily)
MTDYREINALQRDPARATRMAQFLLGLHDIAWTDWEVDFLRSMSRESEESLTTRQAEKLVELRDASVWHSRVDGFSLKLLIKSCNEMRHLLSERDEEFVVQLKEQGTTDLRRRDAARLIRCARITSEIEPYQGRSLEKAILEDAA